MSGMINNQDAFARLRVSTPVTLFDNQSVVDKNPLYIDEKIVGSATSTWNANTFIAMVVNATGAKVVRQSRQYILYQPGQSKLMFFTGVMSVAPQQTGIVARIGCYDDRDDMVTNAVNGAGFFFELASNVMGVVWRTGQTTGTVGDTRIDQTNWNFDKLDGTGPSGYTISDWTKCILCVIDQEWLGVGRVRMGFIIGGSIMYVHYFDFPTGIQPYTRTAKLPVRYEIKNISGGAVTSEMRMICQSVMLEGNYIPKGLVFGFTRTSTITVGTGTRLPLLSIRIISTSNRSTIKLNDFAIFNQSTTNPVNVEFTLNPTLTGATWANNPTNSNAQIDTAATAVSGGTVISSDYVTVRGSSNSAISNSDDNLQLSSDIAGTSAIFCVTALALSATATVNISVTWTEYR